MRILILGGDGYLGWPQALYLSQKGHEVAVFDNFMRRQFDLENGFDSLSPIESLHKRVAAWRSVTGKEIVILCGRLYGLRCARERLSDVQAGSRGAFCRTAHRPVFDD